MTESELQTVYKHDIYPRFSILTKNKGFVIIDDDRMGGTHWTGLQIKDIKSFCYDSFGGAPKKFPLRQLLTRRIYQN